jgi:hypothetical protein
VDSCVFPRRDWLAPILRSARAGYVVPIWSPLIIVEATRLFMWRWIQQHGGDQSLASRRACSVAVKTWFTQMTSVFRIAEDCPPAEDTWEAPRDEWDVPIWSAAKRCGAHFIVTANLRDGPPEDTSGLRSFQGVIWCHPDLFPKVLERWADIVATEEISSQEDPEHAGNPVEATGGLTAVPRSEIPQPISDFLDDLFVDKTGG